MRLRSACATRFGDFCAIRRFALREWEAPMHGLPPACRTSDAARGSEWDVSGSCRQRTSALRCQGVPGRLRSEISRALGVNSELWRPVPKSPARWSALPAQPGVLGVGCACRKAAGCGGAVTDAHARPARGERRAAARCSGHSRALERAAGAPRCAIHRLRLSQGGGLRWRSACSPFPFPSAI